MAHASSKIRRNDTGSDEDDNERSQRNQDNMTSEDIAPISRAFSSHQPSFLHVSAIKLHKLQFGIDDHVTLLTENLDDRALNYCTPHFRAIAWVEIPPLPAGANIELGWIQVITDHESNNIYGDEGITAWEFPELVSGKYKMISDSDGYHFPWYGVGRPVVRQEGPTHSPRYADLYMGDNFEDFIPWENPIDGYKRDPSLTFVYRKQRFYTYLALRDVNTDNYQIIRTVTWSIEIAIDVNPKNPLGERAKLLGPFDQEIVVGVPPHLAPPLESNALKAPIANNSQVFVYMSKNGLPTPKDDPIDTTMSEIEMSRFLNSLGKPHSMLLRMTKSKFLLQQQQKQQEMEEDGGGFDRETWGEERWGWIDE